MQAVVKHVWSNTISPNEKNNIMRMTYIGIGVKLALVHIAVLLFECV